MEVAQRNTSACPNGFYTSTSSDCYEYVILIKFIILWIYWRNLMSISLNIVIMPFFFFGKGYLRVGHH